jgi:transposase
MELPRTGSERRWLRMIATLNEAQSRLYVADKALDLGRGGASRLSALTGMSRTTIAKGVAELRGRRQLLADGRIRSSGAGRKGVEEADPEIIELLEAIVGESTAGDPESPLRWTSKATRTIASELTQRGHPIGSDTVARCLHSLGYSLQANRKEKEGRQHEDRDAQFRFIARRVKAMQKSGDPVISVDTKKKELVGAFRQAGRLA